MIDIFIKSLFSIKLEVTCNFNLLLFFSCANRTISDTLRKNPHTMKTLQENNKTIFVNLFLG